MKGNDDFLIVRVYNLGGEFAMFLISIEWKESGQTSLAVCEESCA